MSFLDDCCTYFCTGMGLFGAFALFLMGIVLYPWSAEWEGYWYLGVDKENTKDSAMACFFAGLVYLLYLVGCSWRIMKKSAKQAALAYEPDV
mmetsp:Transcript_47377/g.109924  ORF Transcript_47377/g.109924 Transcript_47377/m.109924 type:complete len:92 (+) Transcript_47377:48-323(+)